MKNLEPEPYLDEYGRKVFEKLIDTCANYGIDIDSISASIMAQQLTMILRAATEMNAEGQTQKGNIDRQHPSVKTWDSTTSRWLSYAHAFGITAQAKRMLFNEIQKIPISDALDRLVGDDSNKEFESQPHDYQKKANTRTLKNLKNGITD